MQPKSNVAKGKPKYKISDFANLGNTKTYQVNYFPTPDSMKVYCFCGNYSDQKEIRCVRCQESYHSVCVAAKSNDIKFQWECPRCRNFYMDPIFTIDERLIETHYKTESIFHSANEIHFHFQLTEKQLGMPVEVRGLKDGKCNLFWPMQGEFYLNKQIEPIFQLKPLLANSNRKNRKQQALILPSKHLKEGENILTFSIPRLNYTEFKTKYQCEEKELYFIGIYSIKKLEKQELINKTLKKSIISKKDSLKLFRQLSSSGDADLTIQKRKMNLECPYMRSKIKIPVRGKLCRHYTCLCLQTLIQTRVGIGSREWLCPICSKKINEPVVDMFILSIVNDGNPGTQIILNMDGIYEWVQQDDLEDDDFSEEDQPIPKSKCESKGKQKIVEKEENKLQQKPVEQKPLRQVKKEKIDKHEKKEKERQRQREKERQKQKKQQSVEPALVIDLDDESPQENTKEKRIQEEKQRNLQAVREKRNKKKPELNVGNAKKNDFLITEVKQLEFRSMSFADYVKRYFRINYSRNRVPDDLQILFRQVL